MQKKTIKNKNIYIVESHHQVLEAWATGSHLNVFSLDFHTDTRTAFHTYSHGRAKSEHKAGHCDNLELRMEQLVDQKIISYLDKKITLEQINDNLRHDEHLDFAVRTDLINRVFVLAKNKNESSSNPNVFILNGADHYHEQRIIEYSPVCVPGCEKKIHDKPCQLLRADSSIEDTVLDEAMARARSFDGAFFDNYILDIDCDYFNTEKSLYPETDNTFKTMIKNAAFITIALERACVKICRHQGCDLNSDTILERLISLIKEV